MSPETIVQVYDFLPGMFKLAEQAWGLTLTSITVIPQIFLILTSVLLIFASLLNIHGPAFGVKLLKGSIMLGGFLLFSGMSLLCAALCLHLAVSAHVLVAGELLSLLGLSILGVGIVTTTHSVYDAAC